MKKWLRGLIIGERRYFDSWTEYRQVMLSGQFGLIALLAFSFFAIIDLFRQDYSTLPIFASGIVAIILAIRYHREGRHCLANSILYLSLIIIIYLFVSSESPSNGGIVFFIPLSIGAFASFDYKHRKLAMMVTGFAAFMFMAATFYDFHLLPYRNYSSDAIMFNMLIYFVVALPASIISVFTIIKLNHRNAKQLLTSNALLKKSNEELDRFVYSTSHDLRAPLASVLGLINIAGNTRNVDELKKYLGMMKGRVHALDNFIKDITDYSRNNRTELSSVKINLHNLATEIWDSLRFTQKAETIRFEMDFPTDLEIESDPHRLQVILSNLISNAIRYHDLKKEHRYVRLSCKKTDNSFVLSVEDNGQGIAPEYHTQIFQMFFRANESSVGSGLGLYIVSEAIEKLSGKLQLVSVPSQGSTFTVRIPEI
jgi:nitrogen-specific signal transduction histidine kinase